MSFGSGFGGGYQDMGGGGFMTDDSPNVDSSQSKKRQRSANESLMAVTTAMLHKAEYDPIDEIYKFGDIELHQVTLVGVIREVQEAVTNILYKVDDMTGDSIIVRKWIEADENPAETARRSQYREDSYVRIFGHLKLFQDRKSLVAFKITPVKDFNEITFHMLDVVYAHLNCTKVKSIIDKKDTSYSGMEIDGMGSAMKGGGGDVFGGSRMTGMSVHQKQVLDAILECKDEEGMSIQTMKQKIRGINDSQIRGALDFLSNEGHIYSTIDEDHFKSTSA